MIYSIKIKVSTSHPNNSNIKYKDTMLDGIYFSEKRVMKETIKQNVIRFLTEDLVRKYPGFDFSFNVLDIKTIKEDFVYKGGI